MLSAEAARERGDRLHRPLIRPSSGFGRQVPAHRYRRPGAKLHRLCTSARPACRRNERDRSCLVDAHRRKSEGRSDGTEDPRGARCRRLSDGLRHGGARARNGGGERDAGADGDHGPARVAPPVRLLHGEGDGQRAGRAGAADRQRPRGAPGAHGALRERRPAAGKPAGLRALAPAAGRGAPAGHGDEPGGVRRGGDREPRVQLRRGAPGPGGAGRALPLPLGQRLPRRDGQPRVPAVRDDRAHRGRAAGADRGDVGDATGGADLGPRQRGRAAGLPRRREQRAPRGGADAGRGGGRGGGRRAQRAGGVELRPGGHGGAGGERGGRHGARGGGDRRDLHGPHAPRGGGHGDRRRAGAAGEELGRVAGGGGAGAAVGGRAVERRVEAGDDRAPGGGALVGGAGGGCSPRRTSARRRTWRGGSARRRRSGRRGGRGWRTRRSWT
jgi:hypothetical protein